MLIFARMLEISPLIDAMTLEAPEAVGFARMLESSFSIDAKLLATTALTLGLARTLASCCSIDETTPVIAGSEAVGTDGLAIDKGGTTTLEGEKVGTERVDRETLGIERVCTAKKLAKSCSIDEMAPASAVPVGMARMLASLLSTEETAPAYEFGVGLAKMLDRSFSNEEMGPARAVKVGLAKILDRSLVREPTKAENSALAEEAAAALKPVVAGIGTLIGVPRMADMVEALPETSA